MKRQRGLRSVYDHATGRDKLRMITSVDEYKGESAIAVAATQLPAQYTPTQARKIVDSWVEFFSSHPGAITELHFVSRTPSRLFDALGGQAQLRLLFVKWGDYEDLSVLEAMRSLETLRLGGANAVRDVSPLGRLPTLTHLEMESLRHARDVSSLSGCRQLQLLSLGGDWMGPRVAHIDTIEWLPALTELRDLLLHTVIVDDHNYAPLLSLPRLEAVRVMATRGMTPSLEQLKQQLPWSE